MPHSPLERISSTSNINELARNITRQAITRCDQSHQSFHRHIISSSAVRSRVFLLIILSFPYRIFLKQLTMHYPGGVILSRPDPTSRSPRVSPEGAARAPPPSPSWRAPQPPPLARRRRLLLTGLRPLPHRACVAQAPPPPSPSDQSEAVVWGGRGGVTRLRAAGRFKGAGRGRAGKCMVT